MSRMRESPAGCGRLGNYVYVVIAFITCYAEKVDESNVLTYNFYL